jgi:hypothetical protein
MLTDTTTPVAVRTSAPRIALGVLWLVDAALQAQPFMFTSGFPDSLATVANGAPAFVSVPADWASAQVARFPVFAGIAFILVQAAIGAGLLRRRTVRPALVASAVWALLVWWLGEGLGGLPTADPLMGAPGAALLYALLSVLLWPPRRVRPELPVAAGGLLGWTPAALAWLVLWGGLACLAVLPVNRVPQHMIAGMADGEPYWLAAFDRSVAQWASGSWLAYALAAGCALVAAGMFLPAPVTRGTLVLAVLIALVIWVVGENFGTIATGQATDPNTGPLLILLAAVYWPPRAPVAASS